MINPSDIRIVFMGTPEFASVCLSHLISAGYNVVMTVCQPDKPVGRKHILTSPPVKILSEETGIDCYQPSSLRGDDALRTITESAPDLIVTAAYGKILPQNILDIPRLGCINCHGSLLPRRRGAAPVQRAILEGDDVTGVTIMKMDAGMDTGDILCSVEVPISPNVHTPELMSELAKAGSELLIEMLPDYIEGNVTSVKQDSGKASVCPPIDPSEGMFSWNEDAVAIHNRVRALSSWPGACTMVDGKKIKIYDSEVVSFDDCDTEQYLPGTVVKAQKSDLIVKCGKGYLKLNIIQNEGGKRLSAADCAHNYKIGQNL